MSYTEALGSAPAPTSDLQVKAYPKGGAIVWASYQSPSSNATLQSLQRELNRFGFGLSVDGVIGAATVNAVATVAARYKTSQLGNVASNLAGIASGGAERVATKGQYALYFVSLLADHFASGSSGSSSGTTTKPPRSSGGITPPIIAQPPTAPVPDYTASASPAIGEMGPVGKVIMGAGLVVCGALILKEMKKGKKGARAARRR